VKAFLRGSDHHVLEASAAALEASGTTNIELLKLCRKREALGKLRNICVWIVSRHNYDLQDAKTDFKSVFNTFSHISLHGHHLLLM
jgi:hypothetical protein